MPLGDNYLGAIKKFEGFYQKPYWDYKQWTSGFGTKAANPGEVIDQAEADRRLRNELGSARNMVMGLGVPLTPGQEAALTSLTFNAGPKWINSGLGAAVRAGNWDEARNRFLQYTKAGGKDLPGLVARRQAEAAWLTGGAPTAGAAPAVASAAHASSGAPSMAMPPSNGWTPESVESSRRIAKALMGQGMDSSPVGHWTQALARVLQTGVGTAWDSQANVAEREGKQQVADYMAANASASPQQFAAGLVANPFSRDFGQKMILQNMQRAPELEMQRERLKIDQQNAARQSALTAAQLQQIKMQTPEWRMANAAKFGIDPNTPEGRAFVITGNYAPKETTFNLAEGQTRYRQETQPDGTVRAVPIASSAPKIDSTARKAIYEAQDELPNIQSSIETLNEAKALLTGVGSGGAKIPPIYTGWGAQTRSNINQGAPGFLPNIITDPDRAKSTQRYNQIMTSEAIAAMAQSLKGATTNEEMARFISIMNDPSAGPEVKARTIDQMLRSAQRHMQNKQDRIKELGGRMPNLGVGEQQPVRVNSPEEARQLPKGTPIILPDGTIGRVP